MFASERTYLRKFYLRRNRLRQIASRRTAERREHRARIVAHVPYRFCSGPEIGFRQATEVIYRRG